MSNIEWILENTDANMSLEDMPLQKEDKLRIRNCLEGKHSFEFAVQELKKKYIRSEKV